MNKQRLLIMLEHRRGELESGPITHDTEIELRMLTDIINDIRERRI